MTVRHYLFIKTGDMRTAGTDETVLVRLTAGGVELGTVTLSGDGKKFERATLTEFFLDADGPLATADGCGLQLSKTGTSGPAWFCDYVILAGDDWVKVANVGDWLRPGEPAKSFPLVNTRIWSVRLQPPAVGA